MKKELGLTNALYPMPMTVVGAMVDGKPNFVAIAHVGILSLDTVSLGINKSHYTNRGIRENREFSINIPSEEMVVKTDYVGLVSGGKNDKSGVFTTFYGKLKKAPLIADAPVCMECELIDVLDYKTHEIFIGKIVCTHAEEKVLNDGKIDLRLVKPMLFDMHFKKYWKLGDPFADCWSIGKSYK